MAFKTFIYRCIQHSRFDPYRLIMDVSSGHVLLMGLPVIILLTMVYLGYLVTVKIRADDPPGYEKIVLAYKHCPTEQLAHSAFKEVQYVLPYYKKICVHYTTTFQTGTNSRPPKTYAVGFILSETGKSPNEDMRQLMIELGYRIVKFPEMNHAVVTTYPYRFTQWLFVKLVRLRMFKMITKFVVERNLCAHPLLEVFGDASITYILPLHHQDGFYVQEVFGVSQMK